MIEEIDAFMETLCSGMRRINYRGCQCLDVVLEDPYLLGDGDDLKEIITKIIHYLEDVNLGEALREHCYCLSLSFRQGAGSAFTAVVEIFSERAEDCLMSLIGAMHFQSVQCAGASEGSVSEAPLKVYLDACGAFIWMAPARHPVPRGRGGMACQIQIPLPLNSVGAA